jgi:hypothetical protein
VTPESAGFSHKQESGVSGERFVNNPRSNSPLHNFDKKRSHNIHQRLKILNEPPPNYQIEKLTKNFLKNDYQIKSKVRGEKISEIKYKKLSVKDQIIKHQNKMISAQEKRKMILSRDKIFSPAGSKDTEIIESFSPNVDKLAKKIDGTVSKAQELTEKAISRNASARNTIREHQMNSRYGNEARSNSTHRDVSRITGSPGDRVRDSKDLMDEMEL